MARRFAYSTITLAALSVSALWATNARAQGSSLGQPSYARSGAGGLQSSASGSRLPLSSSAASGTGPRLGFGAGGTGPSSGLGGNRGMGGQNGMNGAGGGGAGQGPMSQGLSQAGNDRFQQGSFVGRDAQDVRAGFDATERGQGRGGSLDQVIENLNDMRDSRRRWREQNRQPPPIRVKLQPAFEIPKTAHVQSSAEIQGRLTKIMQGRGVGTPQVEIAGRTAFLRGVVSSEHDRELLARLASLEPGVSQVENLVTIRTPPSLSLPALPPQPNP